MVTRMRATPERGPAQGLWTRRRLVTTAALAASGAAATACGSQGASQPGAAPRRAGPAALRVHVVSHIAIGG